MTCRCHSLDQPDTEQSKSSVSTDLTASLHALPVRNVREASKGWDDTPNTILVNYNGYMAFAAQITYLNIK